MSSPSQGSFRISHLPDALSLNLNAQRHGITLSLKIQIRVAPSLYIPRERKSRQERREKDKEEHPPQARRLFMSPSNSTPLQFLATLFRRRNGAVYFDDVSSPFFHWDKDFRFCFLTNCFSPFFFLKTQLPKQNQNPNFWWEGREREETSERDNEGPEQQQQR